MTFFMSGQDIYDNFHNGTGPEGLSASAAIVNELAGRYQERAQQVQRLRSRMEAAWQGPAAGAANRGLGPLVTEHDESGHALRTAQDLTGRQAGSFGKARDTVVPVPPSPGEVNPLAVLTDPAATATYFQQVAAHNQAAQHNVDVMNGYTGASDYNTERQPSSYGELAADHAGVTITSPDTIDAEDYRVPSGGDSDQNGPPAPSSSDNVESTGGSGVDSATPAPSPSGQHVQATTTPGSVVPATSTVTPAMATGRPVSGVPMTGSGVGVGGGQFGGGGAQLGGGNPGGLPRGGNPGAAPRGGFPGGGPVGGQPGAAGRATAGRGGAGFGGVPVGGGRGRGEDDTERKAPAYLEGGDPEDLFDTDQLTAPSAIGDEDE